MKEKVDPYLRPLYDALYDMMPADKVDRAITAGVIEIAPLAFMRGRTLANAAVILDEAQNTTSMQMKMFLTRLGENSRMIITGDPSQVDLPRGVKSGLVEALQLLNGVEGISIVRFKDTDVVRHPLVGRIVGPMMPPMPCMTESEAIRQDSWRARYPDQHRGGRMALRGRLARALANACLETAPTYPARNRKAAVSENGAGSVAGLYRRCLDPGHQCGMARQGQADQRAVFSSLSGQPGQGAGADARRYHHCP
jgi:hypothetical protein